MAGVDRYLIDMFDAFEKDMPLRGAQQVASRARKVTLPMLLRVANDEWQSDPAAGDDLKITTRMGTIVACRATRDAVTILQADPAVLAIEASRPGAIPNCARSLPFVRADAVHASPQLQESGDGTIVAVIDGGIDVMHEAFRDERGKTRIHLLWDQTDPTGSGPSFEALEPFGTLHTQLAIDGYIKAGKVPRRLGRDVNGHGTHVASIAAGRAVGEFYGGVAPESMIVVVIPKLDVRAQDSMSLGYSNSHVAALKFIEHAATRLQRPVVVNVSLGMNAGAHDGTSLLEEAFDQFSEGGRKPGRAIVKSAGNERAAGGHAQLAMASGSEFTLTWESTKNHDGPDVLELWFPSCDELRFQVMDPSGGATPWVEADNQADCVFETLNWCRLSYTKYHWDNGDSRLQVTLHRGKANKIANGQWQLIVHTRQVRSNGILHAWIERDNQRPIELKSHLSEICTLSIPGTARSVIAVASVDATTPYRVAPYSSAGPTRDGREKPEVAAPGETVIAACGGTFQGVRHDHGTSMAAPHVTGAIALLFSRREKRRLADQSLAQLNANQIRRALAQSSQNYNGHFTPGMGYGVLDVKRLLEEFE